MLVFVEGGKKEIPEKIPWSKLRTNNKINPHMALSWNQTQAWHIGERQALSPLCHPSLFSRALSVLLAISF